MIGLNHRFNVKCMLLLHQMFSVVPLSVVMASSIISWITFVIFTEASLVAWQWLCGDSSRFIYPNMENLLTLMDVKMLSKQVLVVISPKQYKSSL